MLHYAFLPFFKDKSILSGKKQHIKKWLDSVMYEKKSFDLFFQLIINLKVKYYIPTMWLRNFRALVGHSGKRDNLMIRLLAHCTLLCVGRDPLGTSERQFLSHVITSTSWFLSIHPQGCNDTTQVSGTRSEQEDDKLYFAEG